MSVGPAPVVLVGLGPTTRTALEALVTRFDVVALVRPGDADDPVIARAVELGVRVESDATISGLRAVVAAASPAAVVVSSFDRILPADLVETCAFVNVHYAPLPRYRGRATVNWAILNGEAETAITVHRLVPGLDAGGILVQEPVSIGPDTTVTSLYEELNEIQGRVLAEAVVRAIAGDPGRGQDESAATYSCTRVPGDGEIDWSAPTAVIDRLVRSLTAPFPGACTWLGLEPWWIDRAEPVPGAATWVGRVPGRVVRVDRAAGWADVLTGDGVLRLHELHGSDGGSRPAAEVIRSVKATLGLRAADLANRIVELERRLGPEAT